jgi:hypothetical protein
MHQVSTENTLMTKRFTLLCLLILLPGPMMTWAMEPAGLDADAGSLDLQLLQEDIPRGSWSPRSPRSDDRLPSLGSQPMQGPGRRPQGGFRSDLPYGAGYEARQGQGHGAAGSGMGSGSGSGMGPGGGRGAGGGRGRAR